MSGSDQAFKIIADLAVVSTSTVGIASQIYLLKSTATRGNVDLLLISFAANLIRSAEWLFRGGEPFFSAIFWGNFEEAYIRPY